MKIEGLKKIGYMAVKKRMEENGFSISKIHLEATIGRYKYGTRSNVPQWTKDGLKAFKTACIELFEENIEAVGMYFEDEMKKIEKHS